MASKKVSSGKCEPCANTGILKAELLTENDVRKVKISLCNNHKDNDLAAANIEAMKTVGLPVEVIEGKARKETKG